MSGDALCSSGIVALMNIGRGQTFGVSSGPDKVMVTLRGIFIGSFIFPGV